MAIALFHLSFIIKVAKIITVRITKVKLILYQVNIAIKENSDGFSAYCPQSKGCQSKGDSLEGVKQNIQEAVKFYLETLSH